MEILQIRFISCFLEWFLHSFSIKWLFSNLFLLGKYYWFVDNGLWVRDRIGLWFFASRLYLVSIDLFRCVLGISLIWKRALERAPKIFTLIKLQSKGSQSREITQLPKDPTIHFTIKQKVQIKNEPLFAHFCFWFTQEVNTLSTHKLNQQNSPQVSRKKKPKTVKRKILINQINFHILRCGYQIKA
jgi:hypothetical protein